MGLALVGASTHRFGPTCASPSPPLLFTHTTCSSPTPPPSFPAFGPPLSYLCAACEPGGVGTGRPAYDMRGRGGRSLLVARDADDELAEGPPSVPSDAVERLNICRVVQRHSGTLSVRGVWPLPVWPLPVWPLSVWPLPAPWGVPWGRTPCRTLAQIALKKLSGRDGPGLVLVDCESELAVVVIRSAACEPPSELTLRNTTRLNSASAALPDLHKDTQKDAQGWGGLRVGWGQR